MEDSNTSAKMIGALLIGAAIGATLGILFAPDKGSVTRKKISSKGNELSDALEEKFKRFMDDFKNEMEEVKEKTNTAMDNGMAKAASIGKEA